MTWQNPPCTAVLRASAGLTAIVQDKIYQTVAAESATQPYVVWAITTAVPSNLLGETPREDDQRITVNVYARDQSQARRAIQFAADAVEDSFGDIVFGPWDSYETETKLYRYSFDVEVWNDRAN